MFQNTNRTLEVETLNFQEIPRHISTTQGVGNVLNHNYIFSVATDQKLLVYDGFTYLLVRDVICIIDRGRPEEEAVKFS